ncbi:kinase-like protein [Basidiobolus meristosporus CBS 931.73]|uniref:non-specific serine/threonine protein kinase n=1 Tax=Basidiobolus meristosporus CBS 931.73 TaxID=1314790 RepID=A0A1Y1YGP5_9FUNG|nr:kinase-like protein [Basidiobolus meristosporus CBS 931.73]|eukprot:ORX97149.1 kinase-like protein [Basidiobolus meristosporus CBS 931.73]
MSIDNYTRLECLGEGGFGTVWKVVRLSDQKLFAMKEVKLQYHSLAGIRDAMEEAQILHNVQHPNLVAVEDFWAAQNNGKVFIVMEYCAYGDLRNVLQLCKTHRCSLQPSQVWSIFAQVVCAVHWCHVEYGQQNGAILIHRDIKPENIFITGTESIKLGDFGIKRIVDAGGAAKTFAGSPYYMAPELLRKQPYSEKVDIWALGLLLYELCTLETLFELPTQFHLEQSICGDLAVNIPSIYGKEALDLIICLLQQQPCHRPSITELRAHPRVAEVISNMRYGR